MRFSTRIAAITLAFTSFASSGVALAADGADTTLPSSQDTVLGSTLAPATTTTLPSLVPVPRNKITIGYVKVVLSEQRVYAYNKRRRLIASFPASTGANDTTPVGRFTVFSKSAQAYYSPNPGERMKFMTRFTKGREGDNIGFHGIPYRVTPKGDIPLYTPLGITPVSHGCVRLKVSDAKWLFQNMPLGAEVLVIRSRR
jgi:lipoprotein-anchoring transpeptidase ErfK/SrfK